MNTPVFYEVPIIDNENVAPVSFRFTNLGIKSEYNNLGRVNFLKKIHLWTSISIQYTNYFDTFKIKLLYQYLFKGWRNTQINLNPKKIIVIQATCNPKLLDMTHFLVCTYIQLFTIMMNLSVICWSIRTNSIFTFYLIYKMCLNDTFFKNIFNVTFITCINFNSVFIIIRIEKL